ncbi:MAG: DUF4388 domain-containing protein [Nitrospirae bacterium]|nr:DUF4388 domain-containing protein [Candidatus Manganitrophaceae bacterium]
MPEPSISLSGRISDVRVPVLLQFLRKEGKTGVLTLKRNDLNKSIYLQDGDIIFATSLYPDDRLGEILLKNRKINFKQYECSVDLLKKTGKRQGTILVEQGFIAPKELFQGVVFQVKEIILSLFTWIAGEYAFAEGPLPSEELITLQISTGDLILEGIKRIQDWHRLIHDLPPLTQVPHLSTDARSLFQTVTLNPDEREILRLIDGQRTLKAVLSDASMPSIDCARLLYFFITVGILNLVPPADPLPEADPPIGGMERSEEIAAPSPAAEEAVVKETLFAQEEVSTVQKIREAYLQLESQNHYDVLKVASTAGREQIKRAYFRLAKEYHPDRHFEADMASVKKELESLFTRITQAYDTLLTEKKRRVYDADLASGKRSQEPAAPSPRDLFARGQAAFEKGDLRDASYFFQEAINKMPERIDKAVYYLRYGQVLARIPGKLRDAADVLKQGIMLDPTRAEFYLELGRVYSKTGLTQKALAAFSEVLKRDPDNKVAKAEVEKLRV